MSEIIVWEDPPAHRRGRAVRIAEQLRTKPGQWARVAGPEKSTAIESLRVTLIQGRTRGIEPGEFECRRHKDGDDCFLWARYVGNGDGA